jgi:TusA-related sulfurtransferase
MTSTHTDYGAAKTSAAKELKQFHQWIKAKHQEAQDNILETLWILDALAPLAEKTINSIELELDCPQAKEEVKQFCSAALELVQLRQEAAQLGAILENTAVNEVTSHWRFEYSKEVPNGVSFEQLQAMQDVVNALST